MKLLIRIPGQGTDFPIEDISPSDNIERIKSIIAEKHPKQPKVEFQRLISGGKLLLNEQTIADLKLSAEAPIIHLVISELNPSPIPEQESTPPPAVTEIPAPPPPVQNIPLPEPTIPVDSDAWITPELKEYFAVWDLSIRCYELSETHKYLAPKLKVYKALIMANQKQRIVGGTNLPVGNPAVVENLPRQNVDRENAVVGAQGGVEDEGPQDWLDRFYTLFRLSLMLFIVYNYSSTERFFAVLVIAVSIMLYQGGFFRVQRRQRPEEAGQANADEDGQREPDRPGVFRMIWVFLSQFVASLIPQNQAPPVRPVAMFEDIMKNMEKELQGQYEKVKRIDSERQMIGKRIGQLEAQIAECKVVNMELDVADEDSKCFKILGPVLVNQTLAEAKDTVKKRHDAMFTETERLKKGIQEISERFKKEQQLLNELNAKAKQIKEALSTA